MSGASVDLSPMNDAPRSPQINCPARDSLKSIQVVPGDLEHGEGCDQGHSDTHTCSVAAIRLHYRRRVDWHKAEKSLTLQIKAICRRLCDGDKTEAEKLYKAMIAGDQVLREPQSSSVSPVIAFAACEPLIVGRAVIEVARKAEEKVLKKLARQLPAWEWAKDVRGCAELSLAQIIGETGDLSMYANPGKVWKRLGLAPFNGKAPSTWRYGKEGKLSADEWVEIGYSPARRSVMFNVGECFIKSGGDYKEVYDERKAYELERDPEMPKIRAHRRAHRYMVKRFVRDLWKAWRNA